MTTSEPVEAAVKADEDVAYGSILGGGVAGAGPAAGTNPVPLRLTLKDPKAFKADSVRLLNYDRNDWLMIDGCGQKVMFN